MGTEKRISRKRFIAVLGQLVVALFAGIWMVMTRRSIASRNREAVTIPVDLLGEGVTLHNDVICYRDGKDLRFYSSRCTHLGCKLSLKESARLVCPCHGSRFDAVTGAVLSGPAVDPLRMLEYETTERSGIVKVYLR